MIINAQRLAIPQSSESRALGKKLTMTKNNFCTQCRARLHMHAKTLNRISQPIWMGAE